jgi:hypothetical protein
MCLYACMHVCLYMFICMYAGMHVCMHKYVFTHVCMCLCTYISVIKSCIFEYVHTTTYHIITNLEKKAATPDSTNNLNYTLIFLVKLVVPYEVK